MGEEYMGWGEEEYMGWGEEEYMGWGGEEYMGWGGEEYMGWGEEEYMGWGGVCVDQVEREREVWRGCGVHKKDEGSGDHTSTRASVMCDRWEWEQVNW